MQSHHIVTKHVGVSVGKGWGWGVNDDRCNSQSHAELRLCTWLAHDALYFFISLSRQRDSIPLQHLHSCGAMRASRQSQSQRGVITPQTICYSLWASAFHPVSK